MLRPHRHLDLRTSHVHVGQVVLELLQAQGRASLRELDLEVRRRCGDIGPRRMQEVLVLLHGLGALDYVDELDALVPVRGAL